MPQQEPPSQSLASDTPAFDLARNRLQRLLDSLETRRAWVFIALGLFYLAGFNGLHRIGSDSNLYLAIGQNIVQGNGYTYGGAAETVAMPLVPYLLAACHSISPDHGTTLTLGLFLLGGLTTLALTYRLLCLYVCPPAAVLALLLFSTTKCIHEFHYRLLTDAPYLLGVMAALVGYASLCPPQPRNKLTPTVPPVRYPAQSLAWLLLLAGLTIAGTSRIVMLALFLSLFFTCAYQWAKARYRIKHLFIAGVGGGILAGFYALDPRDAAGDASIPTYEAALYQRTHDVGSTFYHFLTQSLPDLFDPAIIEGVWGVDAATPVAWIGSGLLLVLGWIGCRKQPLWLAFYLINLGMMMVFSPIPRYVIPIVFFIQLGTATTILRLASWCGPRRRTALGAAVALLLAATIPNTVQGFRLILEQHQPDFYHTYKDGRYANLPETIQTLEDHLPSNAFLIAQPRRLFAAYSRYTVIGAESLNPQRLQKQDHQSPPLYLLLPANLAVDEHLPQSEVTLGPSIATIPHWTPQAPPLSLHRILPVPIDGQEAP